MFFERMVNRQFMSEWMVCHWYLQIKNFIKVYKAVKKQKVCKGYMIVIITFRYPKYCYAKLYTQNLVHDWYMAKKAT